MPQPYILYGSPDSANLIIRILLRELDEPVKTVWINRAKQEHKHEKFLAINPQGLMPVLVDGEHTVFETAAIALYLTDKHQMLAPHFGGDRSRFLQWLFYLSNTLHADLRVRFNATHYIEGNAEQAALRIGTRNRICGHLRLMESEISAQKAGPWFLGESFSALDIYLGALCRWWQLYPLGDSAQSISEAEFPCIYRLLSALSQRSSVVAACAEESIPAPYFLDPSPPNLPSDQIIG